MAELVQGPRNLGFLVSEANGYRSREEGLLLADNDVIEPGTVLGFVTASKKYVPLDPGAADGSEVASAICGYRKDTTGDDVPVTIIVRDAEVRDMDLIWPGAITDPQKATALGELEAVGIVAR